MYISEQNFKEELVQLFSSRSFRKQNTRQELKCQQLTWECKPRILAPETTKYGKQKVCCAGLFHWPLLSSKLPRYVAGNEWSVFGLLLRKKFVVGLQREPHISKRKTKREIMYWVPSGLLRPVGQSPTSGEFVYLKLQVATSAPLHLLGKPETMFHSHVRKERSSLARVTKKEWRRRRRDSEKTWKVCVQHTHQGMLTKDHLRALAPSIWIFWLM